MHKGSGRTNSRSRAVAVIRTMALVITATLGAASAASDRGLARGKGHWTQSSSTTSTPMTAAPVTSDIRPDTYGLALGSSTNPADIDSAASVGAQWVRFDISWSNVEPQDDSFNFSTYDPMFARAKDRGIKVLPILGYSVGWAVASGCDWKCPPHASYYADYVDHVIRHWSDQITAVEIWNEENGDSYSGTPASYVTILKAAHDKVKAFNRNIKVIVGGLQPYDSVNGRYSPMDWLSGMYASGAQGYFDAVAMHPYCFYNTFDCPNTYADWSNWSRMSQTSPSVRSIMVANGDGALAIWGTEYGAATGGGTPAVTLNHQAKIVYDGFHRWKSYSWTRNPDGTYAPLFIYRTSDLPGAPGMEAYFGVFYSDGVSRKPAATTFEACARGRATTC
jgi:polysaccharide biosynthesis protein PslG